MRRPTHFVLLSERVSVHVSHVLMMWLAKIMLKVMTGISKRSG